MNAKVSKNKKKTFKIDDWFMGLDEELTKRRSEMSERSVGVVEVPVGVLCLHGRIRVLVAFLKSMSCAGLLFLV